MRRAATVVLLAGALLVGCSSEAAEPPSLPSVGRSGEASARPSASPVAGSVPPAAQEPTPQGAGAFARFFYAEVTRAFAEEDPEPVRRLSAPGCTACDRFVASLTALRDNDETVTAVQYNIVSAEVPGFDAPPVRVDVRYDSPEITRLDSSGTVISSEPSVEGFQEELTLVSGPSGWLVQEVTAVG